MIPFLLFLMGALMIYCGIKKQNPLTLVKGWIGNAS